MGTAFEAELPILKLKNKTTIMSHINIYHRICHCCQEVLRGNSFTIQTETTHHFFSIVVPENPPGQTPALNL